jgi:hypothetical protein
LRPRVIAIGRIDAVKKRVLLSFAILVGLGIVIQFVPVDRSNPPVVADLSAPPAVKQVLRASCYDCHSNETRWPWYSRVAPMSWLVAHDVEEARGHFNFSDWGTYEPKKQERVAAKMWEEVNGGDMPLPMYLIAHADARLTDDDRALLESWTKTVSGER